MAYQSEQKFSEAMLKKLRQHCPLVQRVETGETGRGVPDIYCRFVNGEVWVELKNSYRQSVLPDNKLPIYQISWRAGQQAWHLEYFKACGHPVLTVVAMRDGFVVIPLKKRYRKNYVPVEDCYRCETLSDVYAVIHGYSLSGGVAMLFAGSTFLKKVDFNPRQSLGFIINAISEKAPIECSQMVFTAEGKEYVATRRNPNSGWEVQGIL